MKWNRKLGTSKREQGIITPKAPQNRPKPQPIATAMPKTLEEMNAFLEANRVNPLQVTTL